MTTNRSPAEFAADAVAWTYAASDEYELADRFDRAISILERVAPRVPELHREPLRAAYRDLKANQASLHTYWDSLAAAERAAENAWLRAAEAPTNDDLAFEEWEAGRVWR